MSSSMENRPEPWHLHAQMDGAYIKVVRSNGDVIVPASSTRDFVVDTITALKMMGVDHETSVIIYGLCGNPAYHGALKHHAA
jgi:hypothetical protein